MSSAHAENTWIFIWIFSTWNKMLLSFIAENQDTSYVKEIVGNWVPPGTDTEKDSTSFSS